MNNITLIISNLIKNNNVLLSYLIAINIVTFFAFGIDKFNSIKKGPRVRELTLLGLAFIGGSIGALSSMQIFRHKTKKLYFKLSVPIMFILQFLLLLYLLK